VAEALKVLEWAGVLTWQHRITRIRERCQDLLGHNGWRWRVIRTSNAYVFRDPARKSENPPETPIKSFSGITLTAPHDPNSPLERALARFGTAIEARFAREEGGGQVQVT
jgi:hypothetical protein